MIQLNAIRMADERQERNKNNLPNAYAIYTSFAISVHFWQAVAIVCRWARDKCRYGVRNEWQKQQWAK